jgi:hypothetical protein
MNPSPDYQPLRPEKCTNIQEDKCHGPDASLTLSQKLLKDDRDIEIHEHAISYVPSPKLRAAALTRIFYYTVLNAQNLP